MCNKCLEFVFITKTFFLQFKIISKKNVIFLGTKIDNILQTEVKPENGKTVGALALLMLRGEILRKERSILYQTPKKTPIKPLTPYHKTPGKIKNGEHTFFFSLESSNLS